MATSARVRRRAGRMNERGSRSKVAGSRRITEFIRNGAVKARACAGKYKVQGDCPRAGLVQLRFRCSYGGNAMTVSMGVVNVRSR